MKNLNLFTLFGLVLFSISCGETNIDFALRMNHLSSYLRDQADLALVRKDSTFDFLKFAERTGNGANRFVIIEPYLHIDMINELTGLKISPSRKFRTPINDWYTIILFLNGEKVVGEYLLLTPGMTLSYSPGIEKKWVYEITTKLRIRNLPLKSSPTVITVFVERN